MSADLTTVGQIVDELSKIPRDTLVVGYGIEGISRGEMLDGVEVYKHACKEGSDGFTPMDESLLSESQWNEIHAGDSLIREVVVVSPVSKENLLAWCELED